MLESHTDLRKGSSQTVEKCKLGNCESVEEWRDWEGW